MASEYKVGLHKQLYSRNVAVLLTKSATPTSGEDGDPDGFLVSPQDSQNCGQDELVHWWSAYSAISRTE
eukprot:CAMPEP_0194763374 /NCGR_PEP_ID=MMETSP0323_2-20130528/19165_1 /TAXON_ID=2866 ORGANISM="Crypthecodinium cohnii, Strain Seligo" /NCGR_SAMPLE_ID=MMETSP0323_2 /ASSEMBLY_ACC=CAM_ASM_000346 /LENGTH=68 /DNA_ID=CAMNT_0039688029 /DNA_START=127 /DNA_END=333 /DNA_ORIENTATION=-